MKARRPRKIGTKPRQTPRHIEAEHGRCLIRWRDFEKLSNSDLRWLYHVPNGMATSALQGALAKAEGLTSGVWDYCLPVRRGDCPGLVLELKAPEHRTAKNGGLSDNQIDFGAHMKGQGWQTVIAYHWSEAVEAIKRYLEHGLAATSDQLVNHMAVHRTKART